MKPYLKAIAPALVALATTVSAALTSGVLDSEALEMGLVGVAAALVAYAVTNSPVGIRRYAKAIAPAALTILGVVIHATVTGEWNEQEARLAGAGLLAALTTFIIPNVPEIVPAVGAQSVAAAPLSSGSPSDPYVASKRRA